MFDPLDHPRIQDLLDQAEEASDLLDRARPGGQREDYRATLDAIHRDLGRTFHSLARQLRPTLEPLPEGLLELADLGEDDDHTAIPDPGELMSSGGPRTPLAALPPEPMTLTMVRLSLPEKLPADLRELLSLLAPRGAFDDPAHLAEEAGKVQWASGELSGRLGDANSVVQTAVLGLLATRARNLVVHLDVDIGPGMALERLRRHRAQQDLPWVTALVPDGQPETGTWASDAAAFWELLER